MTGRSIRIARIAGIPVGISPWWLVIVALLTWSVGVDYFEVQAPQLARVSALALALASVLVIFAGILAHEFAHALVARRAGVERDGDGPLAARRRRQMRQPPRRAIDELRFALAGPAVTVVLALAFAAVLWTLPSGAPDAVRAFAAYQVQVGNVAIAVFNLLPALPLDGGRVARALIWHRTGDLRTATVITAYGGRGLGYAMIGLGTLAVFAGYLAGLFAALVGMFLVAAATAEKHQVEVAEALGESTVEDLMSATVMAAPAELPLADARVFTRAHVAVPVVDDQGRAIGLLTADRAATARPGTIGDAALRDPELLVTAETPAAALLDARRIPAHRPGGRDRRRRAPIGRGLGL